MDEFDNMDLNEDTNSLIKISTISLIDQIGSAFNKEYKQIVSSQKGQKSKDNI